MLNCFLTSLRPLHRGSDEVEPLDFILQESAGREVLTSLPYSRKRKGNSIENFQHHMRRLEHVDLVKTNKQL